MEFVRDLSFLAGGGEMGERTRAMDWSSTAVGSPAKWPQSLKAAVSICLGSRHPMVLWWGQTSHVQFYNDAYISFLGPEKHPAFLGRSGRECWNEIWPVMSPMLDHVFSTGEATWSEDFLYVLNRNLAREEGYFTFSYSPIRTDDGSIGGIFCACNETTARVLGERRLRTLRDLGRMEANGRTVASACEIAAQTLGENPHDVPFALIYLLDSDKHRAKLVATSAIPAGELGAPFTVDILGADSKEQSNWPLSQALEAGTAKLVSDISVRLGVLPGGPWPEAPETALITPIAAPGHKIATGFLVSGLSSRQVINADYLSFFELVAGQIGAAIANARAYEVERRRAEALAEIDRAKTSFFSNVSHEFRTPLSLILGPLEDALKIGNLPTRERESLAVAHRNSLRLLKLVNSLLDFSRIEAGRAQASYEPTDLASLTADIASNFRSACERAGLKLLVDCPPLGAPVFVDPEMWEKIVLNLLSNAFKFTFNGQVAVSLQIVDDRIALTVCDSGVGVPPDELPRLFERFHRIEGQESRTHEGSGIGLALVQELVKLHSGTITVDSVIGRGTSFTVTIPFGKAHLPQERIRAERQLSSTAVRADAFVQEALRWLPDIPSVATEVSAVFRAASELSQLSGARILIADDNADMRAYVSSLLKAYCEVQTVADGQAAIEVIRQDGPDLVIADVMMPRLDGFGLLRAIRNDAACAELPVILLSARAEEEAKVEGFGIGADAYLVKPFNARELLAQIAASIKMARFRREVERTLANRVEARTRELAEANAQLRLQIEQREKAEAEVRQLHRLEGIGQITSGIAHDFNNLLSVVLINAGLLSRRMRDPGDQEGVQLIRAAAERGAKLISQLLAFSRKQRLAPQAVNFNSTIVGMSDLLGAFLGGTIRLKMSLAEDLWLASVDPMQVESVILNLAINARDAMRAGGVLTLETFNATIDNASSGPGEPVPGQYVGLAVKDTGVGIPDDVVPRVFEPFFTTKKPGEGSGLGLAQVLGFTRQSGGGVMLETHVGRGTSVKVFLPRAAEEQGHEQQPRATQVTATNVTAGILVVDDDKSVLRSTLLLLHSLGYAAVAAASGAEALQLIDSCSQFDLVLADFAMPGMTGVELAEAIRAMDPNLPVVIVTGYAERIAQSDVDERRILHKPFTEDELIKKIKSVLQ
ncbi:response regulator [Bradyrhizobium sp. USDA 4471]